MKRRSFLILAAAAPALARKAPESTFPNWTSEEIDQLLTKSPWAHEWKHTIQIPARMKWGESFAQIGGVGLPSPIPGINWPGGRTTPRRSPYPQTTGGGRGSDGYHTEVRMIIRWASALPIRRAMALHEFGRDGLKDERAAKLLGQPPAEYTIELTGIPRDIAGGGTEEIERALRKTVTLSVGGHRSLHPTTVDVPSPGATVTAAMHFPRWEDVTAEAGEIEFSADLGPAHIKEIFKVRLMTYEGRIEL